MNLFLPNIYTHSQSKSSLYLYNKTIERSIVFFSPRINSPQDRGEDMNRFRETTRKNVNKKLKYYQLRNFYLIEYVI
jgi:hypothetical protein